LELAKHACSSGALVQPRLRGDVALALELVVALENFWTTSDPFEGVRRLETLLGRAGDVPMPLRARALRALSSAATLAGDLELAEQAIRESLDAFRAIGDELGVGHLLHRLAASTLNLRRFRDAAAFARFCGTAPIPCGSGQTAGRPARGGVGGRRPRPRP
jgi:transposase